LHAALDLSRLNLGAVAFAILAALSLFPLALPLSAVLVVASPAHAEPSLHIP
jgi:hypothetical protein